MRPVGTSGILSRHWGRRPKSFDGRRKALQSARDTKVLPLTLGPKGPTEHGHTNAQVPGNKGRWPLGLREWEAHQVLEHSDICYLGFLLRVLTGALLLARVNGGWKP